MGYLDLKLIKSVIQTCIKSKELEIHLLRETIRILERDKMGSEANIHKGCCQKILLAFRRLDT